MTQIVEDIKALRNELVLRAFSNTGKVHNTDLAEVVHKINSCLNAERKRNYDNSEENSLYGCTDVRRQHNVHRRQTSAQHDGQPDESQEWYDYDPDC